MHEPVGGDPLVAVFGATVAAVFDFALPVGVAGGAPAVEADGLAVDVAAIDIGQVAVLQGEAQVPADARIEIHAERIGQALRAVRILQVLALVEQVGLLRQPPAGSLSSRSAGSD